MSKDFSGQISYPIGMRNNNPGNLRPSILPWMGQTGSVNNFCKFKDMSYGLRAMAVDLSNKITKDGLNTITKIITKYAPPSENDTQSYINSVASTMGIGANEALDFNSATLARLMRAQLNVEQGTSYSRMLSDADIMQGIEMIPQSITNRVESFFVDNPALATAVGLGVLAVALYLVFSVFKIKKPDFKKI
jgi:hypothetical protein